MSETGTTKLIFGNWALRGRGHVIRLLMEHLNIPYEEKVYKTPQSWFEDPISKSNPNIQLPYLIDGDFMLDGAMPIIGYVLRTFGHQNFLGDTIQNQAHVDVHLWAIEGLFKKFISIGTNNNLSIEEFKIAKAEFWKRIISPKVKHIEEVLTEDSWYLSELSVIDFDLFEFVSYLKLLFPSKIEQFPKMLALEKKISELPNIKTYTHSVPYRNICFLPVEMYKRFKTSQLSN